MSSSIEDRAKELLKDDIKFLIELQDHDIRAGEKIIELQEEKNRLSESKRETIERMVRKLEASGMVEPEKISATLKRILKDNFIEISDSTVQQACGIGKKRKYDRYQSPAKSVDSTDFQQPVTVATDGSESYTKPDGIEGEREAVPDPREVQDLALDVSVAAIDDLEIRLKEALTLADDKDKRIYQLEMQAGELEVQLTDLKKNPPPNNIDKTEDLQIENDNMKQTITELQEALRANVKASGFTQASHLPKQVWIAAINAINFYRELNKASRHAIEHNDPWKKIVFDVATDGQLKAAKLEGTT